jgi:hypothetical protein
MGYRLQIAKCTDALIRSSFVKSVLGIFIPHSFVQLLGSVAFYYPKAVPGHSSDISIGMLFVHSCSAWLNPDEDVLSVVERHSHARWSIDTSVAAMTLSFDNSSSTCTNTMRICCGSDRARERTSRRASVYGRPRFGKVDGKILEKP